MATTATVPAGDQVDGPPAQLSGRVALVTGASRGIGAAVAEQLVRAGVRTALVSRDLEAVTAVSRRLQDAGGIALPLGRDLSDPASASEAVATAASALGAIDLLVNNAASVGPLGPTVRVPVEQWGMTLNLNLVSALATISAALPDMLARSFGRIVNVSSGAASGSGMLGASAYSASKAGLEMLTRNLAAELSGTGVAVVAVRPGRVDTDMQVFLRAQDADAVGPTIVDRARAFLTDGHLIDPAVPAALIVRLMQTGLSGAAVSVYDERGRALLADVPYVGANARPKRTSGER
ncbi:MAG: SDR family NAD(P)-dependent oxidoreductase [Jatrophihabitans sp.]